MAGGKSSRHSHDEPKHDAIGSREKDSSHGSSHTQCASNGKMRRIASSAGSNLREVTNAGSLPAVHSAPAHPHTPGLGLQWPAFDRDVLHAYRRAYRLNTPAAFSRDYHQWVLTQAGSIGIYSPTIARKKEVRRQSSDQLTNVVRKHFNGLGVQEVDIIAEFLHKVRNNKVTKPSRPKQV